MALPFGVCWPTAQIHSSHNALAQQDTLAPSQPTQRGLGEEGLDRPFPEEPLTGTAVPARRANYSIPLPSFRLLAGGEAQRAGAWGSRTHQAPPSAPPGTPTRAEASP